MAAWKPVALATCLAVASATMTGCAPHISLSVATSLPHTTPTTVAASGAPAKALWFGGSERAYAIIRANPDMHASSEHVVVESVSSSGYKIVAENTIKVDPTWTFAAVKLSLAPGKYHVAVLSASGTSEIASTTAYVPHAPQISVSISAGTHSRIVAFVHHVQGDVAWSYMRVVLEYKGNAKWHQVDSVGGISGGTVGTRAGRVLSNTADTNNVVQVAFPAIEAAAKRKYRIIVTPWDSGKVLSSVDFTTNIPYVPPYGVFK